MLTHCPVNEILISVRKKYFLLLAGFLLVCLPAVFARNTTLQGIAPGHKGKLIRFLVYEDLITYRQSAVASALIDASGYFNIQLELEDTTCGQLAIGFEKEIAFLIPGHSYRLLVHPDPDSLKNKRIPFVTRPLNLEWRNLPENDPNRVIADFRNVLGDFLNQYGKQMLAIKEKRWIDSLQLRVGSVVKNIKYSYLDTYIFYSMASVEGMVNRWPDRILFDKYLKNKPVLYQHPAYMEYFNGFFDHYLTRKSKTITSEDLEVTLNQLGSLEALTDSLGKDSLLRNEQIRELVLIKCLGQLYTDVQYNKANILKILSEVEEHSKFAMHRKIASGLLYQFRHLAKGSAAPVFSLINQYGQEMTLENYRGKWIYLSFFTTWSDASLAELKVIPSLKEKFGTRVEFISICCDESPLTLNYFLSSNKLYTWPFFYWENEIELLESYDVFTFPFFVLIDPKGNIYRYPSPKPSERAEELLQSLPK